MNSYENNSLDNDSPLKCPLCGQPMVQKDEYSGWWCDNCNIGEPDEDECLSVYDAALIWMSNGKDEDYTFGYSEEELENALR